MTTKVVEQELGIANKPGALLTEGVRLSCVVESNRTDAGALSWKPRWRLWML